MNFVSSLPRNDTMLTLTTEAELIALHSGLVKESLHLEYKSSDAIDKKNDARKLKMARDVSAFANADGGQIVYGMKEKDHEPDGLDDGLDPQDYPEIWFEQVLQQHVTPLLTGVKPHHVELSNGRVAVVIDIPASNGDPHQVDGRYYRRHNFNRLIMEHYEVRDMFRRLTHPDLTIEFFFDKSQKQQQLRTVGSNDERIPIPLSPVITNKSNTPAAYAVVLIFIDKRIVTVVPHMTYEKLGVTSLNGVDVLPYRLRFMPDKGMPIFKEQPTLMPNFGINVPFAIMYQANDYVIGFEIRAPGCQSKGSNIIRIEDGWRIGLFS
jgi:Putative DNA-binding domain